MTVENVIEDAVRFIEDKIANLLDYQHYQDFLQPENVGLMNVNASDGTTKTWIR